MEGSVREKVQRVRMRRVGGAGKGRIDGMGDVRSAGSLPAMVWFKAITL